MTSPRDQVATALECDPQEWVLERRAEGRSWVWIAEEIRRLTKVTVSAVAVNNWANPDRARARTRESVRRYRQRYGNKYDTTGRSRAKQRALRMFREEHPDVWQRLLDEECGNLRALPVARGSGAT